jgi:hypothetical protein
LWCPSRTSLGPGSLQDLQLTVFDIEAARAAFVDRGVDGNGWLLQEIKERLPGR